MYCVKDSRFTCKLDMFFEILKLQLKLFSQEVFFSGRDFSITDNVFIILFTFIRFSL